MNNINFKKIGLIIAILAVATIIGYFIYTLFFRQAPISAPLDTQIPGTGSGLPQAELGTPGSVDQSGGLLPQTPGQINTPETSGTTSDQVGASSDLGVSASNLAFGSGGQMQFFNEADGKFYRLGADGKPELLSDKQFSGASNIVWSPTNDKAIIEFPDGSKIRYNFVTKEQVTLPKHWEGFDFSPAGDKIVAKSIGLDPDNRWLVVANEDGSKAKTIEPLGENGADVIASWSPNNQSIAMYVQGIDFNSKEIFFIGQNGENFKSITTEGRGFEPKWSPKGDELLYSVYSADNDYKPTLWLTSAQGDNIGANRRPLGLNTWADKCTYSGATVFCAVPQSLERGAGLFPELSNNTPDLLYRIDSQTGSKSIINLGSSSYTMKNLTVSPDGAYLYFTNTSTNRLSRIRLK